MEMCFLLVLRDEAYCTHGSVGQQKNEGVTVTHINLLRPLIPEQRESKSFQSFFHYFLIYSLFCFVFVRSFSLANFEGHNDLSQQTRALSLTQR
jgi:hypothetical protein